MGKGAKWLSLAKKAFLSKKRRDKVHTAHVAIVPLVRSASSSEVDDAPGTPEQLSSEQLVPPTEEAKEFDEVGCIEEEEVSKAPPAPAPAPATEEAEKSSEQLAAIKIQTAVRVFLAKRKLRAMLAASKLQAMLQGQNVKRQTSSAMRCMQSFTKLQTQVQLQRSRMAEVEMHRRLEQGNEPERFCLSAEDWDDSSLSKEQIRAKLQIKHQAAIKRERTLAYAFSHKLWRSYPKDSSLLETEDADKPNWSWSWLEQWMVTRNWESLQDSKPPNKQGSKSPTKPELRSVKSSPTGLGSPRKASPAAKVCETQSPKISSPVRKTSTQQPASPYRSFSSRKTTPTIIQSVRKPGAKAPAADEKHSRPSPRTPSSFFPRTPERETPASAKNWLQKKPSTKSPYCSPAISPPKFHKTSRALP